MATMTEQELFQALPSNTSNLQVYSPSAAGQTVVRSIFVCNNSASDVAFRIFVDTDGTTYSTATAIFYDLVMPATTSDDVLKGSVIMMNSTSGNIAVRSATGSAISFTGYGVVITT